VESERPRLVEREEDRASGRDEPAIDVKEDEGTDIAIAPGEPYPYYGPTCSNGVQLVDFSDTALTQRGSFDNHGNVSRVGVIGDRLFALSDLGLKTVDITDRDNPVTAGEAMFYSDEEMSNFDECGYGYYPGPFIDPGFPNVINFPDLTPDQIERLIALAENCANGAPVPAAALFFALCFMKQGLRSRRRRR